MVIIKSLWKLSIFFLLIILFSVISGCVENKPTATEINTPAPIPISTPFQKQFIDMDYDKFKQFLNSIDKMTDLQKQDFYNSLNNFNGKYVRWKLYVHDVKADYIELNRYGSMDTAVILYVAEDQKSKLASLNKDDIINIEGMINDETIEGIKKHYKYGLGITLFDGKIVNKQ